MSVPSGFLFSLILVVLGHHIYGTRVVPRKLHRVLVYLFYRDLLALRLLLISRLQGHQAIMCRVIFWGRVGYFLLVIGTGRQVISRHHSHDSVTVQYRALGSRFFVFRGASSHYLFFRLRSRNVFRGAIARGLCHSISSVIGHLRLGPYRLNGNRVIIWGLVQGYGRGRLGRLLSIFFLRIRLTMTSNMVTRVRQRMVASLYLGGSRSLVILSGQSRSLTNGSLEKKGNGCGFLLVSVIST